MFKSNYGGKHFECLGCFLFLGQNRKNTVHSGAWELFGCMVFLLKEKKDLEKNI